MSKQVLAIALGVILVISLACASIAPAARPVEGVSTIVAETLAAVTLAAPPPADTAAAPGKAPTEFPGGSIQIPDGLASGISSETVPAVLGQQDGPLWDVAPEHVRITLQGYALQGKFHEPQIMVFPAAEYAAANESAAANIQTLQGALANPGVVPDGKNLPNITFFNAGPVFQSQVAVVPFQGGHGVRALTEYAQYSAPINNNDMFYHFQGITADGKKYVVAILPITAPVLQSDSAETSVPPAGGVTFPGYANADPAAFENYYSAVANLLNSTPAGDFTPSLTTLDTLIGSLSVAP